MPYLRDVLLLAGAFAVSFILFYFHNKEQKKRLDKLTPEQRAAEEEFTHIPGDW